MEGQIILPQRTQRKGRRKIQTLQLIMKNSPNHEGHEESRINIQDFQVEHGMQ